MSDRLEQLIEHLSILVRENKESIDKISKLVNKTKQGVKITCSIKKFLQSHKVGILIFSNILSIVSNVLQFLV